MKKFIIFLGIVGGILIGASIILDCVYADEVIIKEILNYI